LAQKEKVEDETLVHDIEFINYRTDPFSTPFPPHCDVKVRSCDGNKVKHFAALAAPPARFRV
jgi:hypothetical protein